MEEEIVGVSVRLNQAMPWDSDFQNIVIHSFEYPEGSYFKTGSSFVGLMWLLTGMSEGKIYS